MLVQYRIYALGPKSILTEFFAFYLLFQTW